VGVRALIPRLIDLALPPVCAGCGAEGRALCASCRPALDARRGVRPGVPIGLPSDVPPPLLQLEWCAAFDGPVRAALHALKYGGERRLVGPLAAAAADRWREAGAGGDAFVPVPVHAERARERGFDQAALLAAAIAADLGRPCLPVLERSRATTAQYHLAREARAANVAGAFALRDDAAAVTAAIGGRWIVLVDDVVTTGSTLVACATVLLAAGAIGVSALTIARER
jgi:ComF family protein